jgi:hypothetical protein
LGLKKIRLIDIHSSDLKLEHSHNVRTVSGAGSMSGHVKFSKDKEPYVVWFIFCKFEDGERSINAYWRGIDGLRNFTKLKGKSMLLTMDENPDEEDFGYYYNSHKGLHWLRIDVLDIVGKKIHVRLYAHRIFEADELDEEDEEGLYNYIKGSFKISFDGVHVREHGYPGSINFLDHAEIKAIVDKVVDVKDFNEPYYSFGDPYAKNGNCWFEWTI